MSSINPFRCTTIFVGSLSLNTTESKLLQLFGNIGAVSSVRLCCGYAYINYNNINDAETAIKTMNFRFINGKQCHVMWYQKNHNNLKQCDKSNIFVKNLDVSVDNKILYDTFSVFGEILSCKVQINKITNKSLGYGYIQFIDSKSAQNAIRGVNGIKILNRAIYAQTFKPKKERMKTQNFTNIYVKHIPQSFDEKQLKHLFEKETGGTITHSFFWRRPFGLSACLNFLNPNDAKMAIQKLHNRSINGYQLYVVRAQKKQQRAQLLKRKYKNKRQHNRYHYNKQNTFTKHFIQKPQHFNNNCNAMNNFTVPYGMQPNPINMSTAHPITAVQQWNSNGLILHPQSVPMQYVQPQTIIYNNNNNNNNNNTTSLKQQSVPITYIQPQSQSIYTSQQIYSVPNISQPNVSQPMISQPMASAPMMELETLTCEKLSTVNPSKRKRIIGERLFAQIQSIEPRLAGKITGMLLEMDNDNLLILLTDQKKLCQKINEALDVLKEYQKQKSMSNLSNNGSTQN